MAKKKFVLAFMAFISCFILCCGCSRLSSTDQKIKVHYDRGMKYLQFKDYISAAGEFEKALLADSRCAQAHYQLGLVHIKFNDHRKAANEFAKTVALQPDHLDATLKLAEILYYIKRFPESLILINKILQHHQNYPDALALLARIRIDEGKIDEARRYVEQAIALEPGQARFYLLHAMIYALHKDVSNEEQTLLKVVAMEPENQSFHESLVNFYLREKRNDQAIAYLKQVIQMHPTWRQMNIKLFVIHEEQNEIGKAAEDVMMLCRMESENYTTYLLLGNFYKKHGQMAAAEAEYKKAYQKVYFKKGILEVKAVMADFYLDWKKFNESEKIIDEIQIAYPKENEGRRLKERLLKMKSKG